MTKAVMNRANNIASAIKLRYNIAIKTIFQLCGYYGKKCPHVQRGAAMQFYEKLNFLMDITQTTNSALAKYMVLDASYISRLRSGKRQPSKNEALIDQMSAYFARNCGGEYRAKAIMDALAIRTVSGDPASMANAIKLWLLNERDINQEIARQFLGSLTSDESSGSPKSAEPAESGESDEDTSPKRNIRFPLEEVTIYYGVEGKRKAALYALSVMLTLNKPQTLLLFSDEETSWMTGDPAFMRQWGALMFQVIACGHKIKVIHTISRNLDEMLNAINQWMPLYMTGAIEPYYYPKKRDGVFKRTLFIAPGFMALVSSSVGEETASAANVLHRCPQAVAAYEDEFLHYLQLCQPLMFIFTAKDKDTALYTLVEFEKECCDSLVKTESLSLLTMPENLLSEILERSGQANDIFQQYYDLRVENFRNSIASTKFTEIIKLPEPEEIIDGKVKIALSVMMAGGAIYYTPSEYLRHLQNIIRLLETSENYNACLIQGPVEDRYMVYVKEEKGAIVAKTSLPPVMLAMSESNMTASFWDFLSALSGKSVLNKHDKNKTLQQLNEYSARLKKHL